jgi:GH15 family glucan-1,4-alpha-glucosidase
VSGAPPPQLGCCEQLDEDAFPIMNQYDFTFGEPTGSAAPLAWAEAQYVRPALSTDRGRPMVTARTAGRAAPGT